MKVYKKIKTRKGTIAGRSIRSLAFLGIFLILGVGFIAGEMLYRRNLDIYTKYVYSYGHMIADNISGIAPTKFLETETKDDEYFDIRYTLMTAGIYEDEFKDFYLVVPTEDDLIYIRRSITICPPEARTCRTCRQSSWSTGHTAPTKRRL